MFINIPANLLKTQEFDVCLRTACDRLTAAGIHNYIHRRELCRIVELTDVGIWMAPTIDYIRGGIQLDEIYEENDNTNRPQQHLS